MFTINWCRISLRLPSTVLYFGSVWRKHMQIEPTVLEIFPEIHGIFSTEATTSWEWECHIMSWLVDGYGQSILLGYINPYYWDISNWFQFYGFVMLWNDGITWADFFFRHASWGWGSSNDVRPHSEKQFNTPEKNPAPHHALLVLICLDDF